MNYNYIACGDCLELLKGIPERSIDLVVTDPPYEFTAHGGGGAFGSKRRDYHNQLEEAKITKGFDVNVLHELVRVMKKINIYIWCNKDQLRQYIDYFEGIGSTTDLISWHKTNPVPTCNNKYLSDTEYLLFFREKGVPIYGSYESKKKYYVTPTNKADKTRYGHPTIKPLNITQNLIINSSQEGDIVLDPFLGSGTTAVAAINKHRRYIGFEKEPRYYAIACQRIAEAEQMREGGHNELEQSKQNNG